MKNIIYKNPSDAQKFDLARYVKSLNQYSDGAKITTKDAEQALTDFNHYDTLHASCLVEVGTRLLAEKATDATAEKYFNDHAEYFDEGKFERLRRITGYLVGTLDRWNDAKKAEESARVKHSVNSSVNDATRLVMLETQAMDRNIAYAR